ncbi:MAG: DUF4860 domain-containing protein [Clostridiales bacterium]|nr:DUF4860 domain-containing protein [Clostridiales bacterium]
MNTAKNSHTIDVVFVLAVACAFAASVLTVLMLGANVYGSMQKTSEEEFKSRVCLSYIAAKIHANDSLGKLHVGTYEGAPALYLDAEFDGTGYNTIIYSYDGWLRELFCEKGLELELSSDSGTPVLEIGSVSFENALPNLLSIEFQGSNGDSGKLFVNLRCGGGVGT